MIWLSFSLFGFDSVYSFFFLFLVHSFFFAVSFLSVYSVLSVLSFPSLILSSSVIYLCLSYFLTYSHLSFFLLAILPIIRLFGVPVLSLSICLSICLFLVSIFLCSFTSTYLSVYLPIYIYLSIYLQSIYLPLSPLPSSTLPLPLLCSSVRGFSSFPPSLSLSFIALFWVCGHSALLCSVLTLWFSSSASLGGFTVACAARLRCGGSVFWPSPWMNYACSKVRDFRARKWLT